MAAASTMEPSTPKVMNTPSALALGVLDTLKATREGGLQAERLNGGKEDELVKIEADSARAKEEVRARTAAASEVKILKLTETQALVGAKALSRSSQSMVQFTRGLFAAFTTFDNNNPDFVKFRAELADGALTFKTAHLPLASFSVTQVKHFLKFYADIGTGGSRTKLNFEEWAEDLPIYIKKLDQLIKVIQNIVLLTEDLRGDIVVYKASTDQVLKKFQMEMDELARVEGQELEQQNRATWWKENVWRYVPALGPFGALMCNITINKRASAAALHGMEKEKTGLAAQCFKNILIPSAEAFVECMNDFASFFEVLKQDLTLANQSLHDLKDDGPARAHFRVVNTVAESLNESCEEFTKVLPEFRSDLNAVEAMLSNHGCEAQHSLKRWLEKPRRGQCWKTGLMDMMNEMKEFKNVLTGGGGDFAQLGPLLALEDR